MRLRLFAVALLGGPLAAAAAVGAVAGAATAAVQDLAGHAPLVLRG